MTNFLPEGILFEQEHNRATLGNLAALQEAMVAERIVEARAVVCEGSHNLVVDLGGGIKGVIPREEAALGIIDGSTRDIAIISRVNKPVAFLVTGFEKDTSGKSHVLLSRRKAQQACLDSYLCHLTPGDIIPARVTHLEQFGAFVDIGCGVVSLIPIDMISISRIAHPKDRFTVGQNIRAVVKSVEGGRISLSHKELLGSWAENVALFRPGETVAGIVRSVESYGIFVELTPNLAGLAELREEVTPGQQASVFIKSLIPDKMKVKLIIIDAFDEPSPPRPYSYFLDSGHIDRWQYSPPESPRLIETIFEAK